MCHKQLPVTICSSLHYYIESAAYLKLWMGGRLGGSAERKSPMGSRGTARQGSVPHKLKLFSAKNAVIKSYARPNMRLSDLTDCWLQCIIISGESGSGKTVSAHLLVQQLAQLGMVITTRASSVLARALQALSDPYYQCMDVCTYWVCLFVRNFDAKYLGN